MEANGVDGGGVGRFILRLVDGVGGGIGGYRQSLIEANGVDGV